MFEIWRKFPNLLKNNNLHTWEAQGRPTDRPFRVRRLKVKDKENILEKAGEKQNITYK